MNQGLLSIHLSVLLFGLTALFSKFIDLPALDITPLRSLFAVIVLLLMIGWRRQGLALGSARDALIMGILGVLIAVHWVTYFYAMQVSTIAVGVISLYTYPVITVFLEPLFYRARPRWQDVVSAAVVLFGVYLMVPDFDLNDETAQGVLWGIFSALLFALRNILQRKYLAGYPAQKSLFYQALVVFLLLMPFVGDRLLTVSPWQWGQLALLGVFFTALPHTLYAHGLRFLEAKSLALIGCLQVVYSALFAALLLAEVPPLSTLLGGALVISAALYESYFAPMKRRA